MFSLPPHHAYLFLKAKIQYPFLDSGIKPGSLHSPFLYALPSPDIVMISIKKRLRDGAMGSKSKNSLVKPKLTLKNGTIQKIKTRKTLKI